MIVSASYKTDIPAFYGGWFMNRLRAGYCKMVNPYNRRPIHVSLSRNSVDGIVFWTKNLSPFVGCLEEVRRMGYPFIVQYAINAYPRALEFSVVDAARAVRHMHWLCDRFGSNVAVWRYDPIVFTSVTDYDFHLRNFERLAGSLRGTTNEVIVSVAQIYRKTQRNMDTASEEFGFEWNDPSRDTKHALLRRLAEVAGLQGMQMGICSQRDLLVPGAVEAACVSAKRLASVGGGVICAERKGNRPDCACDASRDIGEYDTCPHGCVYCYAVENRSLARLRYKLHDPMSEFLFQPDGGTHRAGPEQLPIVYS